ncbi:hypothetical protein FYA67_16070 [Bordetella holmesii]|nr:hypothetical protein H558_03935 [Bordetella holmesii H558]AOB36813.1 hypothetical protein BBB42_15730 [Bordetella holmesii]AUL20779.1 hypothetical protein BTL46_15870 [Bordetella holmesii]AUL24103.1 hypothetical protein BTL48_15855 [Bordetella holmesii]AUL27430.1 hypothetical protein BTL49_15925 [Bordetella holmesii]
MHAQHQQGPGGGLRQALAGQGLVDALAPLAAAVDEQPADGGGGEEMTWMTSVYCLVFYIL